jgi:hypothetical protein
LCDVALGSELLATYILIALMVGMHRHAYANHEAVLQDPDLTAALQVGLVGLWVFLCCSMGVARQGLGAGSVTRVLVCCVMFAWV